MSISSEHRARKADREAFTLHLGRRVVQGFAASAVLAFAVLLVCLALQAGGAL